MADGPLVICRRRGAIYLGVGGSSALLAGLGLFELRAGRVGSGIVRGICSLLFTVTSWMFGVATWLGPHDTLRALRGYAAG